MTGTTLLSRLAAEYQLHSHAEFLREYRKAAASLGVRGAGPGPSRAQLHRWFTGRLAGLPHPHHRRVLEAMFPGRSAEQLFAAASPDRPAHPRLAGGTARSSPGRNVPVTLAGASAAMSPGVTVYPDRAAFRCATSLPRLVQGARRLRAVGVSLGVLRTELPPTAAAAAVRGGAELELLLLDPAGTWSRRRSVELGHGPGHLAAATLRTLDWLEHVRGTLGEGPAEGLTVGLYDEPPRYGLLLVDDRLALVQAYLPHAPAAAAPLLLVDAASAGGLYAVYEQVFDELLDVSVPR